MVTGRARFARCPDCGRLIVVDVLNPSGHCTPECGAMAVPRRPLDSDSPDPFERAMADVEARWGGALDLLADC